MSVLIANNAATIIASNITALQTTIPLNTGTGSLFPNPTAPDVFIGTLQSASNPSQIEIVRVTARSGDTLTVVRGIDGTTAQAFNASDIFSLLPTRATDNLLRVAVSAPTSTGSANAQTVTNTVPIPFLANGAVQTFNPGFTNTGPMTLATDSLAATQVFNQGAACLGGECQAGVPVTAIYLTANSAWNILNAALPSVIAGRNFFTDPCCQVAQVGTSFTVNLATSFKYGQVDLVKAGVTGGTVSAGTIVQATAGTVGFPATIGTSCRLLSVTTGAGASVEFQRFLESLDATALAGPGPTYNTATFSCVVEQNTGAAINYSIVIDAATAANNFANLTTVGTSPNVSVPSGVPTLISFTVALTAGCYNGILMGVLGACGAQTTKTYDATDFQAHVGSYVSLCAVPRFSESLMQAMRYYEQSWSYGVTPATATFDGMRTMHAVTAIPATNGIVELDVFFTQEKAIVPTVTSYSSQSGTSGKIYDQTSSTDLAINGFIADRRKFTPTVTPAITAGDLLRMQWTADGRF